MPTVAIIGAGLAGSEAALVLGRAGVQVDLYEMRPGMMTPAHKTDLPAELVCSNSFKAINTNSAHGLLKTELEMLDSPLLKLAKQCSVPAGSALAVDREQFSRLVAAELGAVPSIKLIRQECVPPVDSAVCTIIAAGPLASESITHWIRETFGSGLLNFYDAIAPIVSGDSIDMTKAFFAERDNAESTDYINCPFGKEEYQRFYEALVQADKTTARAFEDAQFFEACLPVEVIANRGFDALAFGVLKPIGMIDPRTGKRPYGICQLRRENRAGDSYNMVGFQTRLTIPDQIKVFRLIPGLEQTEFLRYGSIHRNTYINSPEVLGDDLSFKRMDTVFCAGQLCGSEGYTESVSTGHYAARAVLQRLRGEKISPPPPSSALGALINHVVHSEIKPFSPSNINYGLFPALPQIPGRRKMGKPEKWQRLCERAKEDLSEWIQQNSND